MLRVVFVVLMLNVSESILRATVARACGLMARKSFPPLLIVTTTVVEHSAWVDLKAGLNHVVAKTDNRRGYWGLQLEWYDEASHEAVLPDVLKGWQLSEVNIGEGLVEVHVSSRPATLIVRSHLKLHLKLMDMRRKESSSVRYRRTVHLA